MLRVTTWAFALALAAVKSRTAKKVRKRMGVNLLEIDRTHEATAGCRGADRRSAERALDGGQLARCSASATAIACKCCLVVT